ncbi:hypothetical protein CEXT_618521 [Caerostris extrusa]|uniref:Uncharacterized protein n=1 Tax=Caerostris extrusa TaxID=172846 RepID=A0AAV4P6B0_CAEEX|nr:hypothetical protein CEXT_618521 [Caerostris extrusa]
MDLEDEAETEPETKLTEENEEISKSDTSIDEPQETKEDAESIFKQTIKEILERLQNLPTAAQEMEVPTIEKGIKDVYIKLCKALHVPPSSTFLNGVETKGDGFFLPVHWISGNNSSDESSGCLPIGGDTEPVLQSNWRQELASNHFPFTNQRTHYKFDPGAQCNKQKLPGTVEKSDRSLLLGESFGSVRQ